MTDTYRLDPQEGNQPAVIRGFLQSLLAAGAVRAVLVPQHLPLKRMVMPTLVTRPEGMGGVDPLAPCFPMNAARIASRLARKPMGVRWAAVLRPCEIRAWVELVKLKQARTDEVVLVSIDCLGAFQNKDYVRLAGENPAAATQGFVSRALAGEPVEPDLAPACRACEFPVPPHSDIHIGFLGCDGALTVEARSLGGPGGGRIPQSGPM